MKTFVKIFMIAAAAAYLTGCGSPAANAPASNANAANTAKPVAAAPTADALLALDKQANEAYFKGDSKFFEGFLSDKAVLYSNGQRIEKADFLKELSKVKCEIKEGWKLEDPKVSTIDADTYVLAYKGTMDGSCTVDGKTEKAPSPFMAATVFVRNGDKWQAVTHGENLIVEAKAPAAAEPKKEEAKKEEPKKEEPKKEEPKKEVAKKDEKPAANTAANAAPAPAPAKATPDANTDALVKIHLSGWEAFKAKDAKKFDEITAPNLAIVDPAGNWVSGKAEVIKRWTETMKCEGVTKVGVSDGFASALSPTVEILTLKGTADGTCDGQKNGELYQTAIYVKEGGAWKLAFMFESLAKQM
jgi:ketosteroid isomerase-like protein